MTNEIVSNRITKTYQSSLDDLIGLQGDLKSLDKKEYKKFKNQLLTNGFVSPFITWIDDKNQRRILDGHTRRKVLMMMRDEGIQIPSEFPCVEIQADSEKKAKEILLGLAFNYAKVSDESLSEFMLTSGIDFSFLSENISLPSDISLLVDPNFEPGSIEDQQKLDEKKLQKCPECGHEF